MVQGGFADARTYLEEALDIYDRARGMKFESIDWTVYGTLVLAAVCRHSGAPVRARELIEQAKTRVDELPHGVTFAITYTWTPFIEALRGDARAALRDAERSAKSRQNSGSRSRPAWLKSIAVGRTLDSRTVPAA